MGMQLKRSRLDRCRLLTFDKFDDYYNPERLIVFLAPLFQKGLLGQEAEAHIRNTSEFQTLFRLIHEKHAYYRFLDHAEGVLPKTADEAGTLKNIFRLPPAAMFDAVFIDGCKRVGTERNISCRPFATTSPLAAISFFRTMAPLRAFGFRSS